MSRQAKDLSSDQKAAAELLVRRPIHDQESISVHAFEAVSLTQERRNEVAQELRGLFAELDSKLQPTTAGELTYVHGGDAHQQAGLSHRR